MEEKNRTEIEQQLHDLRGEKTKFFTSLQLLNGRVDRLVVCVRTDGDFQELYTTETMQRAVGNFMREETKRQIEHLDSQIRQVLKK